MKLILLTSILFSAYFAVGQSNLSQYKLKSVNLLYGPETFFHGLQQFDDFSNTVDDGTFFVQNDSNFEYYRPNSSARYNNYCGEIKFGKADSKWSVVLGGAYNQRIERLYYANKTYDFIVDTLYTAVPTSTSDYDYMIYYDTLLLDSIMKHDVEVAARSKNIFISAEIHRDFKKNKYTFSTGIGLALGMSIKNEVTSTYYKYWGMQMGKQTDIDYNTPIWYADIPQYTLTQGTLNPGALRIFDRDREIVKGNSIFIVKPYIPIRIEAVIAEKGFFSKVGVMGSASAGVEFQMIKNDGIRSRFFWNYKAGIFVRI